jgi:hypothetical protein
VSAAALALLLSLILGLNVVEASQGSLPGDRLYPLKIGLEGLHHALTRDAAEQCALHLEFARERVEEIANLVAEGRAGELSGALAAFEREMLAASWAAGHPARDTSIGSASLRTSLEAEALSHDEALRGLLALAPEEARPGLEHALIVLNTGRGTIYALFIRGGSASTVAPTADGTIPVTGGADETLGEASYGASGLVGVATPSPVGGPGSGHVQVEASPGTDADAVEGGAAGTSNTSQVPVPSSTPLATGGLHGGPSRTPTPTPTPAIDVSGHR